MASSVLAHQDEVAGVSHQDLPVTLPVAGHLLALGFQPSFVGDGLYLDDAPLRLLPRLHLAFLHLLHGVKAEIRMVDALVRQFLDTEHLGTQRLSHSIH